MKILYKLKNNGADIDIDGLQQFHYNVKATLVNEDAVTCAINFNKLVNVIMNILQSKQFSPFGHNYVPHYFKRIEFQHRGSPHAHIIIWLNDAPTDILGSDQAKAVKLIDEIVSVSEAQSSGLVKPQRHKHSILSALLRSNMDLQFIIEEYSCAAYVVEYVNKTNRGIAIYSEK